MTELPASIHVDAGVGEVEVARPLISLRGEADWRVLAKVTAGEEEREVRGPWFMAVAVKRWGEAASSVYALGTVGTEKFERQRTILLGSQAMVETMIDSRGGWENGFRAVRGELSGISFPRAIFENIPEDQLLLARRNLEKWWLSRRRGVPLKENTAGRRCADMIMGVKSESGQALAYELVRLGLTTIAGRRRTYGGEASIPLPSEALGPLRFFGIELLSENPVAGDEPRRTAEAIKRASDMRATSMPGASESTEARRKRLTEAELAFRGEIAELKAIVKERKSKKSMGVGQAPRAEDSPSAADQGGGREQRSVVAPVEKERIDDWLTPALSNAVSYVEATESGKREVGEEEEKGVDAEGPENRAKPVEAEQVARSVSSRRGESTEAPDLEGSDKEVRQRRADLLEVLKGLLELVRKQQDWQQEEISELVRVLANGREFVDSTRDVNW